LLEDERHALIVSWGVSGDSFVVKDQSEFAKSILPMHFKHSNFASFVRQLNKYDFHKVKRSGEDNAPIYGEQAWEFRHPMFLRKRYDLLESIRRK
ncbi:HSF-type DNA-binding-domain-containing protein, partial [Thamnocephalis sphaerospora]